MKRLEIGAMGGRQRRDRAIRSALRVWRYIGDSYAIRLAAQISGSARWLVYSRNPSRSTAKV